MENPSTPQNAFLVFWICFYNRSRKRKDTIHFINLIENAASPEAAILATLDECSFYTNILREVGIESFVASTKNTISLLYLSLLIFWAT